MTNMAEMTKGELLKFVINNIDAINNYITIEEPNALGIGHIKFGYNSKKIKEVEE